MRIPSNWTAGVMVVVVAMWCGYLVGMVWYVALVGSCGWLLVGMSGSEVV